MNPGNAQDPTGGATALASYAADYIADAAVTNATSAAVDSAEINPLDTGLGRLIPTTSCNEFFAEMALWLGVPHRVCR